MKGRYLFIVKTKGHHGPRRVRLIDTAAPARSWRAIERKGWTVGFVYWLADSDAVAQARHSMDHVSVGGGWFSSSVATAMWRVHMAVDKGKLAFVDLPKSQISAWSGPRVDADPAELTRD